MSSDVDIKVSNKVKHSVTMLVYVDGTAEFSFTGIEGFAAGKMQNLLGRATKFLKREQGTVRFAEQKAKRDADILEQKIEQEAIKINSDKLNAIVQDVKDEIIRDGNSVNLMLKLQLAMKEAGYTNPDEEVLNYANRCKERCENGRQEGSTITRIEGDDRSTDKRTKGVSRKYAGQSTSYAKGKSETIDTDASGS